LCAAFVVLLYLRTTVRIVPNKEEKMATRVYDVVELELQDGSVVEIRPLSIKRLRNFMEKIEDLSKAETEIESLSVLSDAATVAIQAFRPDVTQEQAEDILDMPTIWKILEIAGGIKAPDPNLLMEAALSQVGQN
jgi:hypothetical protein